MDTHAYSTTLSDTEWEVVRPLLPQESRTGRPRQHSLRTLLDAIFYAVRAGCAWRLLPQEWPPWKTVYHYFLFSPLAASGQSTLILWRGVC
jgi:putative transposase